MAEAQQARAVQIEATVGGQTVYVAQLDASMTVGASSWPYIHMIIYPPVNVKQAIKPTQEDIIAVMAAWQKKMFSARNGPEVTIKISVKNDKDAGTFSFKGLITGPEFDFSGNGRIALAVKCVPEYAQIDNLTYSIYAPPISGAPIASNCNLTKSETICNYIKDKQKELMTKFEPDKSGAKTDKEYKSAQHTLNKKVVKYFEDLLEASNNEECFGWTDILQNLKRNDKNLTKTINQLLITTPCPFCNAIDRTAETFGCIYVPGWENIGYFKNKYNLLMNPEPLEVDTIGMSVSAASGYGLLPIGYVGVVSPYYTHTAAAMGPSSHFVCYPKEHAQQGVGAMYQTIGPVWINDIVVDKEVASAGASASARKKGAVADDVQEVVDNSSECKEEETESALNILEKWGKAAYINHSLSKSSVLLVVPLTFQPQVGKYYTVRTKEGTTLFTGLLAGLRHSIAVAQNHAQTATTLEFSHVQINGFTLPHAN